jgi:hypothetical protein
VSSSGAVTILFTVGLGGEATTLESATSTVAATAPPTILAVTTTAARTTVGEPWPEGAPFVDLYEDDHYKRTEQLEAFNDWRTDDSTREEFFALYTKAGTSADGLGKQNLELRQSKPEANDCTGIVDSVTRWRQTDSDNLVWIQVTSSSPACTGIVEGKPATRAFIPLQVHYWLWEEQSDGRWLVIERVDTTELLEP